MPSKAATRVRHLIALDSAKVVSRLELRQDEMVTLFSKLRDRGPLLQTVHSWFGSIAFSELSSLEPFEQRAVSVFYGVLDELRWYLQYTEDMPGQVQTRLIVFARRLKSGQKDLAAVIGEAQNDGAPVVDAEVIVPPKKKRLRR